MIDVFMAVLIVFTMFLVPIILTFYVLIIRGRKRQKKLRFYLLSEDCQCYELQQNKFKK